MPVSEYYSSVIRGARMGAVTVCGNPPLRVSLDSRCPRERTFPSRRSPMESSHEQAHLPAEQPSSQPHARFPLPHAYPRRSRHPERPSSQGSHGTVRLIPAVLPRSRRLRRSTDFTATFRQGVRAGTPSVVVHVAVSNRNPSEETRVGFVVSKAIGNAVTRNRVKRRLRHLAAGLPAPFVADVVVRALPPSSSEPERLAGDLESAWRRAFTRAMC